MNVSEKKQRKKMEGSLRMYERWTEKVQECYSGENLWTADVIKASRVFPEVMKLLMFTLIQCSLT